MSEFNVAILGAGYIAGCMAEALVGLKGEVKPYAVASRDLKKAEAFAEKWGFEKAYGSYEEMVRDPQVDLVYVATPHSHHYEHAKLCIEHGKPALVEKAFTGNARQAEQLLTLAEEKGVFITEAMWTRFIPARHIVKELLESGIIGEARSITAEYDEPLTHVERLCDPALAGGALLDIGIYPLTFTSMYFGDEISSITSSCEKYTTGVDGTDEINLVYQDGKTAKIRTSFTTIYKNEAVIEGTKGSIRVKRLPDYESIHVYDTKGTLVKDCPIPPQINGYEYEVLASKKAILEGKLECEEISHAETLLIMRRMDALREAWGVRYPFD